MASAPDIELSQSLGLNATSTAHLRLKESAHVDLQIKHTNSDQSVSETTHVTTTATECSWNLYATAKLLKPTQVSNRAKLVDITSNGQIVRVGNAIFTPQSASPSVPLKSFTPSKFSLYVDSMEQHDQYLFLTSRQDVTTIPEVKDEPVKDERIKDGDAKSKDEDSNAEDVKKGAEAADKAIATSTDAPATAKAEEEKDESSDDDDSSDKIPKPESDDSSSELSANESWSEASTEYDSDQQIAEFRPVRPPQERVKAASDSESSSDLEEEPEVSASEDSEDENNLVEGKNKDERGRWMDSDEESERFQAMFVDDRVDPGTDIDDQDSAQGYEDDDFPEMADWSDGDGFQAMGSDSEECSECGEDGGACALPPKDDALPPSVTDKSEELEEPVGSPASQIHIYDLSENTTLTADSTEPTPSRIFHFKRATQQTLANSPPAVHPTKALLVWPLGDNRILFADYLSNTYFVRKFQSSQFWSSHVSVNCRFSKDGNYLHVVAVEKSGKPPLMPVRVRKGKSKADAKKDKDKNTQKPKEEKPKYEMIVSTYRMSQSKTTRVPPVLIGRVQKNLGEVDALPRVSWSGVHVYVSLAKKSVCQIYRIDLGYPSTSKLKRSKKGKMTMQCLTAEIPEWATGRDLQFLPSAERTGEGQLIIAAEATKIPPYKPKETETEIEKSTTSEISKVASAIEEITSAAPTAAKPEMNEITPSDGKSTRIDAPKTSDTEATQSTQTKSEDTSTDATTKKEELTNTPALTSLAPSISIDPKLQSSDADKSTASVPTPIESSPKPNPYPQTMTTTLSPRIIKSLGGWCDIIHATYDADADAASVKINADVRNGTGIGVSDMDKDKQHGEPKLSFSVVSG